MATDENPSTSDDLTEEIKLDGLQDIDLLKISDVEDQGLAKEYHLSKLMVGIASQLITTLILLLLWFVGLDDIFAKIVGMSYSVLSISGMFILVTLLATVLSLPFDIYSNVLERRYDFSTETWKKWGVNQLKSLALNLVLMGTAVVTLYFAIDISPEFWWFYGFWGAFVFLAFIQTISPLVLIPLFMKIEPLPDGEVREKVEVLAKHMGISYKDIYLLRMSQQTKKANAMVTGFGNSIRIVLGDTLVNNFRADEIEVVMAHEIGHQKNKDVYRILIFLGFFLLLVFFLIDLGFQAVIDLFSYSSKSDPRTMFYMVVAISTLFFIFQPVLNYYSRTREKAADLLAIREIGNLDVYESAFTRLAKQNLAYLHPSKLDIIFNYSHPPILERIRYAKEEIESA